MNEIVTSTGAPLEKVALEIYQPPAKPSLIGLSREEISEHLGELAVPEKQRKMR
ncbi:MAG: 23S rRNA (adenine(2503)-C(2))-methyltransferase RlmN, partial [Afipia sp.]|nr:23S rRNA (adenine(2503)-C(2))-methyltransferase RlmN [Afipia sp.]